MKENRSRDYFISRADIEKIIAICPNNEWKLVVSLAISASVFPQIKGLTVG